MRRRHRRILEALFAHPVSANIQWREIEALFIELAADISERGGGQVAVVQCEGACASMLGRHRLVSLYCPLYCGR